MKNSIEKESSLLLKEFFCVIPFLFTLKCTINGTAFDLQLDWSVATSQYFNTAYFVGYVITQLPGGYLAVRFSPTK